MKLSFRPLAKTDYPQLAAWLAHPHVQRWWHEEPTVHHVAEKYDGRVEGTEPTAMYVVQDGDKDIGIMQCYLIADHPDYAALVPFKDDVGIDYFIGATDYIGRGVGTAMIKQFIETVINKKYPSVPGVTSDPEVINRASLRVLQKVGFEAQGVIEGEHGPEQLMRLPLTKAL